MFRRAVIASSCLLMLAGCSVGNIAVSSTTAPAGSRSLNLVAQAADATASATSYRFELSAGRGNTQSVAFNGERSGDLMHSSSTLKLGEIGGMQLESILASEHVYLRGDMFRSAAGPSGAGADDWYRIPIPDISSDENSSMLNPIDGAKFLAYVRDARGEVTEVGSDEVRGVATTKYRLAGSIEDVLTSASSRDGLDRLIKELGIDSKYTIQVWIGEDSLVHRLQLGGEGGGGKVTVEFFDIGQEISIAEPTTYRDLDPSRLLGEILGGM